jgi:hypothetical protein
VEDIGNRRTCKRKNQEEDENSDLKSFGTNFEIKRLDTWTFEKALGLHGKVQSSQIFEKLKLSSL